MALISGGLDSLLAAKVVMEQGVYVEGIKLCRFLEGYRRPFTHLKPLTHGGPLALLDGLADADDLNLAARLVARFSQGRDAEPVGVQIVNPDVQPCIVEVSPLPPGDVPQEWFL